MLGRILGTTALALSLAACTTTAAFRERQNAELARYEAHAGAPVDEIRAFTGVDQWQSLSPTKLAIWTSVNRAYLLTLRAPCNGLEFQSAIGISSTNNIIMRRFDKVVFENQQCFIEEIRPVDYKAMKQQRRADKAAQDSGG